jgi:MprA protease rhombosortase-interaction domain-containing protein
MKQFITSVTLLVAIWGLTSISARAQPGSGGPGPGPADPTAVPLDGGASLLLAGGVAYGLRKLRARRPARQAGTSIK